MNYHRTELADRLKLEGEAVEAFFHHLAAGQWEQQVYQEGDCWRARDLLAHFIAAEQGFQQLIESVARSGPGAGPDFDIDAYNSRTVRALESEEKEALLLQFAQVRERTAAIVRGLEEKQMEASGRHPALGEVTVGEMVRAIYHHNSLHLRDLKHALRGAGPAAQAPGGGSR